METLNTWSNFWGKFLLVDFHKGDPERWRAREHKAKWIWENAGLTRGAKVLDLGCGDGILDICLARLGANVTAVDTLEDVIESARGETSNEPVTFVRSDIRELKLADNSFNTVILFETIGLMKKQDDQSVLAKAYSCLSANGTLLVDCPYPPEKEQSSWTKEFPEGILKFELNYNSKKRIRHIDPLFTKNSGEIIKLHDPYNTEYGDQTGIFRYLYSEDELSEMLERVGFVCKKVAHYSSKQFYLYVAIAGLP